MRVAVYGVRPSGRCRKPMFVVENATTIDDAENKWRIEFARKPGRYPEFKCLEFQDLASDEYADLLIGV